MSLPKERKEIIMPNTQRTRKNNNRNANTNNVEALVSEQTEEKASVRRKPIIPKDIDASQFVTVRNGFQGKISICQQKNWRDIYMGRIWFRAGNGVKRTSQCKEFL